MLKIWFKPTCSTCRTALASLKDEGVEDIEIYEYLKEKPSQKEIREILKMLGLKAFDLVRQKEELFKTKYSSKKLNNAEWIKILSNHPELIERPIVVKDGKAIIGRPVERVLDIL
ncbi:MAG: arsenate reductase (glutaredoxin) [Bacteroidetes bacterium]|nr:arsenate reductase (glutaredoxin) [Bacteroidota bacterium]MBL0066657.1 arsenate reductase (glutaredoxin) [Bacteroidota bacterium]MBL0138691.1 arsenate reductase (glutaredoxin) [Bacteroidota bacterium]